jgi:hypothetical protein
VVVVAILFLLKVPKFRVATSTLLALPSERSKSGLRNQPKIAGFETCDWSWHKGTGARSFLGLSGMARPKNRVSSQETSIFSPSGGLDAHPSSGEKWGKKLVDVRAVVSKKIPFTAIRAAPLLHAVS